METSFSQEKLKDFLKSKKILLVDPSSTARTGLKKLLCEMGAAIHLIHSAGSIEEAQELINAQCPTLIFCDFEVEGKSGLELLQKQRESNPDRHNQSIFILVTANTSQSAVAQAAEEDIDAYILKPYTVEGFTRSVSRSVQNRIEPSKYLQLINEGKALLEKNNLDKAFEIFASAVPHDEKPSLACYYEGLINFKKVLLGDSQQNYETGLSFSKIHYKCLVGLFDLLMSMQKFDAAYDIVKKLIRFFPSNPKRLATVIRLAIQTGHIEDVETFYNDFLRLDNRTPELTKNVCAAMIVCGRYYFERKDNERGNDLIMKACISAAGNAGLLKKAIYLFVEFNQIKEAKSVLSRFQIPADSNAEYAASKFSIDAKMQRSDLTASQGIALLNRDIKDKEIYLATIDALKVLGKYEVAANYQKELSVTHPVSDAKNAA